MLLSLLAASRTYTITPAGVEAWAASSPRPPSARQAPKLNKGSPLPRQRIRTSNHDIFAAQNDESQSTGNTSTLRPAHATAIDAQRIFQLRNNYWPFTVSFRGLGVLVHSRQRKLNINSLARRVPPRVTQHLHDHTSGSSRSCLTPSR